MREEQLLLFPPTTEDILKNEVKNQVKAQILKYGKGQWGEIGRLKQDLKDVKSELEFLKSCICKTGLF